MKKVAVVVPTIREQSIMEFIGAWRNEFTNSRVDLIVVEDNPSRSFSIPDEYMHLSHASIKLAFKKDGWIIPRRTDCVRSLGFWHAWRRGAEIIISMDDDVRPDTLYFIQSHINGLAETVQAATWRSTLEGVLPRGYPYGQLESKTSKCVINHGMWSGVLDVDAVRALQREKGDVAATWDDQFISPGQYYPMCGMNVAFTREILPAMYFLLMGGDYVFDRFGDIWCGILSKKICDHLGFMVRSGFPVVEHVRASNAFDNLVKEAPGIRENETFWQAVDSVHLTERTVAGCYKELAHDLPLESEYWLKTREAMTVWAGLFE